MSLKFEPRTPISSVLSSLISISTCQSPLIIAFDASLSFTTGRTSCFPKAPPKKKQKRNSPIDIIRGVLMASSLAARTSFRHYNRPQ